jgi:hypothetical protein
MINAINTWAIPVAGYIFGVVKWSETAVQSFDRKIRTTLTKQNIDYITREVLSIAYTFLDIVEVEDS